MIPHIRALALVTQQNLGDYSVVDLPCEWIDWIVLLFFRVALPFPLAPQPAACNNLRSLLTFSVVFQTSWQHSWLMLFNILWAAIKCNRIQAINPQITDTPDRGGNWYCHSISVFGEICRFILGGISTLKITDMADSRKIKIADALHSYYKLLKVQRFKSVFALISGRLFSLQKYGTFLLLDHNL